MVRIVRLSLLVLLAGAVLAGCGKRGQLEPPPSQTAAQKQAEDQKPEGEKKQEGARKRVPIVPPKRDLPIDWILE